MARILILGGYGFTGRLLARHLLAESAAEIVLAGRDLEKASALAARLGEEFGSGRVTVRRVDAASSADLRDALKTMDVLLVAAPTAHHAKTVVGAALEAGVDYLDIQLSASKLALLRSMAGEIQRSGRCFITEAGFHPGLPSALVRYAGGQLDVLESAVVACYLNMGSALPYSEAVDELIELFRDYEGKVYRDRQWTKPRSYLTRKVDFGGDIGVRNCFSLFLEELGDLPRMIPQLTELGFFMSTTHWLVDWVLTPIVFAGLKVAPKRGIRPLGRMLWWGMQTFPKPPYLVDLKIEAEGFSGAERRSVELSLSHTDGYELTAIPVAACLLQVLDGSARRPGLWMMGHLVDPRRLMTDMERMGVRVTRKTM